jgi:site-specific DNA recombinase
LKLNNFIVADQYIRVSTQGQARDGYNLKYQEGEIKAYCDEQGLNLIHIFRDEGISSAKLNEEALEIDRVGLQEMLAHLLSVQIECGSVEHKPIMEVRYRGKKNI